MFELTIICLIYFIISILSVSIGGTSLITVPILILMGLNSRNAIATNMFALIFLSLSGAFGFRKQIKPSHYKSIIIFVLLTIIGSFIGAKLVLDINEDILQKIIAIVICIIAISLFFKKKLGIHKSSIKIPRTKFIIGSILIFILGIYGGFFSGGYVTLLTYTMILLFGMSFLEVASITKIINLFSSTIACIIFFKHGLIDFNIGIPIAISAILGGLIGSKLAIAKGSKWIRNLFIIAIFLLAIKLFFL